MIYDFSSPTAPLRQGDIFVGLPRIDISLQEIMVVDVDGERVVNWGEIADYKQPVSIIVPVRSVTAIVATQDCDAARSPDITLCEVRSFGDVERKCQDTKKPTKFVKIITQHSRINQKWFYLPPDDRIGLTSKMAVDFLVTLRIPREDLEKHIGLRRGRLNAIADEHFRERIGEFFRRYPYDEWYALDEEEMAAYQKEYADAEFFPWQRPQAQV